MKHRGNLTGLEDFEAYHPSAAALRSARERNVELAETLTQGQRVVSLVCCLIAAGIMIETLFFKFTGAAESIYIFKKMGTEPWWRWGQGIWELFAAALLLLPRLRWAGGILTTGAMLAAIISHLTWLGLSIQGDHGLLFGMALMTFSCGVTVMILHRHEIPFVIPPTDW